MKEATPSPLEILKETFRKVAAQYADETLRKYVGDAEFEKYKAAGAQEVRALVEANVADLAQFSFDGGYKVSEKDARDILEGTDFYKEVKKIADDVTERNPDWITI